MSFKDFLIKKVLPSFFMSVTFILLVMAILGTIFFPNQQFGYEGFWFPVLFGTAAVLPQFITYSKKELTAKQVLLRNALHLVLLETTILLLNYLNGARYSMAVTLSLALAILIIDVTVHLVLWINDKKTAKDFNESLRAWQESMEAERQG